ncbi:MAG: ferredoxin [Deltaproteobacteria bacterium]|jgi:ferredoxin|nr:ferredoxin [Deltaproteobacteria bacterium]MCZ6625246.1 ferredoxin [Deltaproteobacteria bacterium]
MKVTVDQGICDGTGKCVEVAPKVFKMNERMCSEVIDPNGDTDEKILFAAKLCPVKAIFLEEDGTGKRIFP